MAPAATLAATPAANPSANPAANPAAAAAAVPAAIPAAKPALSAWLGALLQRPGAWVMIPAMSVHRFTHHRRKLSGLPGAWRLLSIALLGGCLALSASAMSRPGPLPDVSPLPPLPPLQWAARDGRPNGGASLGQSAERVRQATGGRVLDAREVDGQHRIKVLTPRGEVRVVWVDPRTGAMR